MIKFCKLFLCFSLAIVLFSCKKNNETVTDTEILKVPKSKMTLPGLNNVELYLNPQVNGQYTTSYGGGMTFGTIPHKTANFIDGEHVESIEIVNNGEFISVQTVGPFFTVIRPSAVGAYAVTREQFQAFEKAFYDFIYNKKDEFGTSLQDTLPRLDDYVNPGDGMGHMIIKGQVVMSSASPSLMSVVSSSFVAPSGGINPGSGTNFLGVVQGANNVNYYCRGGAGIITEVYTLVNGVEVPFTSFSDGYYLVTVNNLWKNINLTIYPGTPNEEYIIQNVPN